MAKTSGDDPAEPTWTDVGGSSRRGSGGPSPRALWGVIAVLGLALALVVGTFVVAPLVQEDPATPDPVASGQAAEPTPSVTTPAAAPTTSAAPTGPGQWPEVLLPPGTSRTAPSPAFPAALPGWTLASSWSTFPRVPAGGLVAVSGPGGGAFPATTTSCSTQRFLLRWQADAPDALVQATWSGAGSGAATGAGGWLDTDGCRSPTLALVGHTTTPGVESEGLALTDVAVQVQRYVADGAADPADSPACGVDLEAPAVLAAIAAAPPDPSSGYSWAPAPSDGNYDPCAALSGVLVQPAGGTGGTPVLVLLFHDGELVGPATSRPTSFTRFDTDRSDEDTVVLGFRVPGTGTCNACDDFTENLVEFTWQDGRVAVRGQVPS